jgi:hypothetical protein
LFANGVNLRPNYDRDFFVENRKRATSISYLKLGNITAKGFDIDGFLAKGDMKAKMWI